MACTTAQGEETVPDHVCKYHDGCGSGHRRGGNSGMVLHEGQEDMRVSRPTKSTRARAEGMMTEMSAIEATNMVR